MEANAFARLSFLTDGLSNAFEFARHLLVRRDDVVKGIRDLSWQAGPGTRQTDGEVALLHSLQACQNDAQIRRWRIGHSDTMAILVADGSACFRSGRRAGRA